MMTLLVVPVRGLPRTLDERHLCSVVDAFNSAFQLTFMLYRLMGGTP